MTIPSEAPTFPPAPRHAAVPERGAVEQGIESSKKPRSGTHTRSGAPSVFITRRQAGMQPTRIPSDKKPVTPATKVLADTSDSPPIRAHKGLPTKGAYSSATQPPSALTPALTSHEKGEKSRVDTPSTATTNCGEGYQLISASSLRTRFSTPSTALLGESLEPTEPHPPHI